MSNSDDTVVLEGEKAKLQQEAEIARTEEQLASRKWNVKKQRVIEYTPYVIVLLSVVILSIYLLIR